MADVKDSQVFTVEPEVEGDIARRYVLTIDIDPATNRPVLGVRDVTNDEDFSEPDVTDFGSDTDEEDTPPVQLNPVTE